MGHPLKVTREEREEMYRRRVEDKASLLELSLEFNVSKAWVSELLRMERERLFGKKEEKAPLSARAESEHPFTYHWQPRKISVALPHVVPGITMARLMSGR